MKVDAIYASELYQRLESLLMLRFTGTRTYQLFSTSARTRHVENYAKSCDECVHVSVARAH